MYCIRIRVIVGVRVLTVTLADTNLLKPKLYEVLVSVLQHTAGPISDLVQANALKGSVELRESAQELEGLSVVSAGLKGVS